MDINKIRINDHVIHTSRLYTGVVVSIDHKNSRVSIKMDDESNGTEPRIFLVDKIELLDTFKAKNNSKILQENEDFTKEEKYKIGEKVIHNSLGNGVISSFLGNSYAYVDFGYGKGKKLVALNLLSKSKSKYIVNQTVKPVPTFDVGDDVFVKDVGEGTIVGKSGPYKYHVKFKNDVLNHQSTWYDVSLLKRINFTIQSEENVDEVIISKFNIIPSNYSKQNCYPKEVKLFLNSLKKTYTKEGLAAVASYYDPDKNDCILGLIALPTKGAIIFQLYLTPEENIKNIINNAFLFNAFKQQFSEFRTRYYKQFLNSKNLCSIIGNEKQLKFPIKFVNIFQNLDVTHLNREELIKINELGLCHNLTCPIDGNDPFDNMENQPIGFSKLTKDIENSILERVLPEYVTLTQVRPEPTPLALFDDTNRHIGFTPINGKEREFRAVRLDDDEIKLINNVKNGLTLTLANPGTGKSVILVSKAFRIASMNPTSRVLITCFNKNLASHHDSFANISLLRRQNMNIQTFHSLLTQILETYDTAFIRRYANTDVQEEQIFELFAERVNSLLDDKRVCPLFDAIYIDEVQLFEPLWLEICYKLLIKNEFSIFDMYGDMNQDINTLRSKGKAPWQLANIPNLNGRIKKLTKNYRNSNLIARYLNSMIESFSDNLNKYNIDNDEELSALTSETTIRGKMKPNITNSTPGNFRKVIDALTSLLDNNVDLSDVAILFPARRVGKNYQPLSKILKMLIDNGIDFDGICSFGYQHVPTKVFNCKGVILSTIDSSLGLDFKYVILCGLHAFDLNFDTNIKNIKLSNKNILGYIQIAKKIYTACSRAKEGLIIIDDTNPDSFVKRLIRPKKVGGTYIEK